MNICDDYCSNHGCNRGPGCPAGSGCHGRPGCKDTNCPGHPSIPRIDRPRERGQHRAEHEDGLHVAMSRVAWALIFLVIFAAIEAAHCIKGDAS